MGRQVSRVGTIKPTGGDEAFPSVMDQVIGLTAVLNLFVYEQDRW